MRVPRSAVVGSAAIAAVLIGMLVGFPISAAKSATTPAQGQKATPGHGGDHGVDPRIIERGKGTFALYCANCHGFDGVPNLPGTPDFSRGEGLQNIDAALINAIRFGVRSMPGFDQTINKEELIDVVFYIRTLQR